MAGSPPPAPAEVLRPLKTGHAGRRVSLRLRLTALYCVMLVLLLLFLAALVQGVMRRSLVSNINRELEDTYRQITNQNLQLVDLGSPFDVGTLLSPPSSGGEATNLSKLRRNFPNYSVQVEWTVQDSSMIQANITADARTQAAELAFVRQVAEQRRQLSGIDPNEPIELSDAQLTTLLAHPEQALYLNMPVKAAFSPAQPYQVMVKVADLNFRNPADGSMASETAIVYVGKNLEATDDTLSTLLKLMSTLFGLGLLCSSVGAYILAGRALRPLQQVKRAADDISGQNLSARVPVPPTNDEVEALASTINNMLGRLEGSFEAQRRFTSDASHELRTPVTAISGHASYLLRRTEPSEQQRESLSIIRSEAERLTGLIGSLLELARSDGGVMQLRRGLVLPQVLLGDTLRELQPLAHAQQAELRLSGEEEPFEGDADRLKQVVINLVSNALKAGATQVTLSSAAATTDKGEAGVRLSVIDNGPGIAREHLEKLFDRFYRVEESRSRDQGGAGLGLAIARSIVDAHGGRIWFESEVGLGTTVHVWLPRGDLGGEDDDVA